MFIANVASTIASRKVYLDFTAVCTVNTCTVYLSGFSYTWQEAVFLMTYLYVFPCTMAFRYEKATEYRTDNLLQNFFLSQ